MLAQTPTVDFNITPDTAICGKEVIFTNLSVNIDTTTSHFIWTIEYFNDLADNIPVRVSDTTNSFLPKAFTYTQPGNYTISLVAVYNDGVPIGSKNKMVNVRNYLNSPALCSMPDELCDMICNGNFESYEGSINNISMISHAVYCWNKDIGDFSTCATIDDLCMVDQGTPDYFNSDFDTTIFFSCDVPSNHHGYQQSHSSGSPSQAYAGIYSYNTRSDINNYAPLDYKEYLNQRLETPLVQGSSYTLRFYYSLSENSAYASPLSVMFSMGRQCQPYYYYEGHELTGRITPPSNAQVFGISSDSTDADYDPNLKIKNNNWYMFQVSFVAQMNYDYLTLGNFEPYGSKCVMIDPTALEPHPTHYSKDAYYYIDDVSLYQDSVDISPLPDSICYGGYAVLDATEVFDPLWSSLPIDTSLLDQDNAHVISVCPATTTVYTLTYNNVCQISDTVFVLPELPPSGILGNRNNCDLFTSYQIANPRPNTAYQWTLSDTTYSNDFPTQGQQINIHWNQLWDLLEPAGYVWMYLASVDTVSQCNRLDSVKIWNCCVNRKNAYINDTVISNDSIFIGSPTVLNGTITINNDITVAAGNNIFMGPEAKIVVNPPFTFTIKYRTVKAGCAFMWDGIYITDSNAKIEIENSTVQDAYNAVNSANGGKFTLHHTNFYNNYTSVLARNYVNALIPPLPRHKGSIYACYFGQSGTTGLIAPYLNAKPRYGIFANNVYMLTIGDSSSSGNTNTFNTLFCGIASFNSSLGVYNNSFINIKNTGLCTIYPGDYTNVQCETAVHSVRTNLLIANSSMLNIGGSYTNTYSGNSFDNTSSGIYTYKTTSRIRNSSFSNTADAIVIRDFSTGSYISRNTTQTNTPRSIKAINTVQNGAGIKLGISYNTLTDPTYGIRLINVVAASSGTNKVTIDNNLITLNGSATTRYGIWCENSNYTEVYCNNISRTTLPSSNYRLTIRGIQMNQCINGKVRDNTTIKLGTGIRGAGSLLGTQFKCNTSNGNYNGFYFDAAYNSVQTALSNQGISTLPNDNKWYSVPAGYSGIDAANGFILPTGSIWYYRTSGGQFDFTISLPAQLGGISKVGAGNPTQSSCSGCGSMSMAGQSSSTLASSIVYNETEMGDIISESNDYYELDESFKYFEKQYAYTALSNATSLTDITISEFYNKLLSGNIGHFNRIYCMIQNEQYDSAASLNNSILPDNQLETNRKWVNGVYLEYVAPQYPLSQSVIDELETLASSSPYVNGDAVYTARAIVGYTEAAINPKSIEQENAGSDAVNIAVRVYPNPAQSTLSVEVIGLSDEFCKFAIRNTLGTIILERTIHANGVSIDIDVSKLSNGIYFYEVLNSAEEKLYSNRLVIIK